MSYARSALVVAALLLAVTGCSSSESTDELAGELAAVTAERDALSTAVAEREQRHDRALATLEEVNAILNDPTSFGSEQEVVDAIAAHSTETAMMVDEVFGAVNYRTGFYNTLYGGTVDARIDTFDTWVSEDGTEGGVLWIWYGTNAVGNPFELVGLSHQRFDEDGRIDDEVVTYPYTDEYVNRAFLGEGTPTPATG